MGRECATESCTIRLTVSLLAPHFIVCFHDAKSWKLGRNRHWPTWLILQVTAWIWFKPPENDKARTLVAGYLVMMWSGMGMLGVMSLLVSGSAKAKSVGKAVSLTSSSLFASSSCSISNGHTGRLGIIRASLTPAQAIPSARETKLENDSRRSPSLLFDSTLSQALAKKDQIPVWILNQELAQAFLSVANPIPAIAERLIERQVECVENRFEAFDVDLEHRTAAEGVIKRARLISALSLA